MKALDALGNPVRRDIIETLRERPLSVRELAEHFPISRPAISRHLRLLEESGLVSHAAKGNRNVYWVRPDGFLAVRDYAERMWDDALPRFALVVENLGEEE